MLAPSGTPDLVSGPKWQKTLLAWYCLFQNGVNTSLRLPQPGPCAECISKTYPVNCPFVAIVRGPINTHRLRRRPDHLGLSREARSGFTGAASASLTRHLINRSDLRNPRAGLLGLGKSVVSGELRATSASAPFRFIPGCNHNQTQPRKGETHKKAGRVVRPKVMFRSQKKKTPWSRKARVGVENLGNSHGAMRLAAFFSDKCCTPVRTPPAPPPPPPAAPTASSLSSCRRTTARKARWASRLKMKRPFLRSGRGCIYMAVPQN